MFISNPAKRPINGSLKRCLILLVALALITLYFWTQSRYPQLNGKELMGERNSISALAFDPKIPVAPDDGVAKRIYINTLNWCYTNQRGMTFGILFAATFLALMALVNFRSSRSSFLNALGGMFIGAPMGVCTNCAAPISKSLSDGGCRLETSLATLFSSPTLNIIALSMLFGLFPLNMAVIKVGGTLFLILVALPLLTKYVFVSENENKKVGQFKLALNGGGKKETWMRAFGETLKLWLKSFGFVFVTSVPLMILSGFLGVVVAEFFPVHTLTDLPFHFTGALFVALVGVILPVPMTFDLIFVTLLMNAGLNQSYAMILLFTLGPFSIYPFLLLWRTLSFRVVGTVFATIMVIGLLCGAAVQFENHQKVRNNIAQLGVVPSYEALKNFVEEDCRSLSTDAKNCVDLSWRLLSQQWSLIGVLQKVGPEIKYRDHILKFVKLNNIYEKEDLILDELTVCANSEDKNAERSCVNGKMEDLLAIAMFSGTFAPTKQLAVFFSYKRACEQLGSCRSSAKFFEDMYARKAGACDSAPTEDLKKVCLTYQHSVEFRSWQGKCDEIKNSFIREHCLMTQASSDKELNSQINFCAAFGKDESEKSECVVNVIGRKIKSSNPQDESFCESIGNWSNQCRAIFRLNSYLTDFRKKSLVANLEFKDTSVYVQKKKVFKTDIAKPRTRKNFISQGNFRIDYFDDEVKVPRIQGELRSEKRFSAVPLKNVGVDGSPAANAMFGSGDYDNDGWIDLLVADGMGLRLFRNLGGWRFVETTLPELTYVSPLSSGFIDINNDGALDLYVSSERYFLFILNENGRFDSNSKILKIGPMQDVQAVTFADIDHDGKLDFFLGGAGADFLYKNEGDKFLEWPSDISFQKGFTHAGLFTDFNSDGNVDLFVGNDYDVPDEIFVGNREGRLKRVQNTDGLVSGLSWFNMGYDSADINNDLRLDLFTTEAAIEHLKPIDPCEDSFGDSEFREICLDGRKAIEISETGNATECSTIKSDLARRQCFRLTIQKIVARTNDPSLCEVLPETVKVACPNDVRIQVGEKRPADSVKIKNTQVFRSGSDLKQIHQNTLHIQRADGSFAESAVAYGVAKSDWAWNARIHDYDNDGWQDIFVVSATLLTMQPTDAARNFFFRNNLGKNFENKSSEYGLDDFLISRTYAAEDFDGDGDIDIIASALSQPFRLYRNNSNGYPQANSISFSINDEVSNRFGVGTKIYVSYGDGQGPMQKQVREIKSNGGYRSPNAPLASFGLGKHKSVHSVEVVLPDGNRMKFDQEFLANRQYVIIRHKSRLAQISE